MRESLPIASTVASITALVLATSCASSPPSKFYTLSAMPSTPATSASTEETVVAISPVTIPLYLDRPQIVTRASENELKLAEFDRWAGSLREDLGTVMTENLAELLRSQSVTVLRAGAVGQRPVATRYRIGIDMLRFEGAVEGPVILKAQWVIVNEESGKLTFVGESSIQEAVEGTDYVAVVAAMSRALANLSREITVALNSKALGR